ncbi:MAG: inositol monophosphatase family protein [Proteobacteria bacterium]|nr:inositol monophosphatase family protein [Pseudomonadota bacterium]
MLKVLEKAAYVGGDVAKSILPTAVTLVSKDKEDFATTADLKAQEAIKAILEANYPNLAVIAEEDNHTQDVSYDKFITIDPFDGTIIGSRGSSDWGVLISYIEHREIKYSVMYQPIKDNLVIAEKNKGTILKNNNQQRELKLNNEYNGERLVVGFDINYATTAKQLSKFMLPLCEQGKMLVARTSGSAISGAMDLLLGLTDIYINPCGGKIWDFAPTVCAVEAAGGVAMRIDSDTMAVEPYNTTKLFTGVILARNKKVLESYLQ